MQLTLTAHTSSIAGSQVPLADGCALRSMNESDIAELAALYFKVYPRSVVEEIAISVEEMRMTFAGDFGILLPDLSPVVTIEGNIVSAIMSVQDPPWEHTPEGLFIIEVFTAPAYQRRGLARAALTHMANDAVKQRHATVGLRVESENVAAMALYQSLGFTRWKHDH